MNDLPRVIHLIRANLEDRNFIIDTPVEWLGGSCDGDFINVIYQRHPHLPVEGVRIHVPRFARLFSENSDEDLAFEVAFNIREPHEVSGESDLPWGEGIVENPEHVVWTLIDG